MRIYSISLIFLVMGYGVITSCNGREAGETGGDDTTEVIEQQRPDMEQADTATVQTFEAILEGSNEVPPVNTEAKGTVTVELRGDSLYIVGEFSDLSSQYVASHIHKGVEGQNGDPIFPLKPTVEPERTSGSFDGSYQLDKSQISALKNDSLYVNIHTAQHKEGEIRGQLTSTFGAESNNNE